MLAIDGEIEHDDLSDVASRLQPHPDCPYFFAFRRQLLPNKLSAIPGRLTSAHVDLRGEFVWRDRRFQER
jgi:hypothetical protein